MFFALLLLVNILLLSPVLAAPARGLGVRVQRRAEGRQSDPLSPVTPNTFKAPDTDSSEHIEYSSNWAGAILEYGAGSWKTVTGTFVVPTPKLNPGQTWASASAWVGIDGDTCQHAILQTGIDFTVYDNGQTTFDAWYEWWPDYAHDFSGFKVKAGDTVTVTVTAYSKTSGIATIHNHSTGKTVSKSITSSYALCEQDAEWIVEDYSIGGLVPLANWGKVEFKDASATTKSGKKHGPKDASIAAIVSAAGKVVTKTKTEASRVEVSYVKG